MQHWTTALAESLRDLRWAVVYVYLDPVVGREQSANRPALVVSDDAFNNAMEVVTVLPITTRKAGRQLYPNEVLLPPDDSGLESESIVLAHQIRTISAGRIKRVVHRIASEKLQETCLEAVRIHLGMY